MRFNFFLGLILAHISVLPQFLEAQAKTSQQPARPSSTLSPQQLFKRTSPSVFIIERLDSQGKVSASGSGVLIAKGQVLTNAHVVRGGGSIHLRKGKHIWNATVLSLNNETDLCIVTAAILTTPVARIRRSDTLVVGETVYAIGSPKGLELTLSSGLISGFREYGGSRLIQTTTPISTGSSGGGLFDQYGMLVGVTSFTLMEGQNLNFAIPADLLPHEISVGLDAALANVSNDPFPQVAWLQVAKREEEAGRFDKAIAAFKESIRLDPGFVAPWEHLCFLYLEKNKQPLEAVRCYQEVTRRFPNSLNSWNNLGVAFKQIEQYEDAENAFKEAIRLGSVASWGGLATTYLLWDKDVKAVEAFQESIKRMPSQDAGFWMLYAKANRRLGRWDDAIAAAKQAVRLDPENAMNWDALGWAYSGARKKAPAIEAFKEATRLNPNDASAWEGLGLNSSRPEECISALREAIRLGVDDARLPKLLFLLGFSYSEAGDRSGVLEVYNKLKALDSGMAEKFFDAVVLPD